MKVTVVGANGQIGSQLVQLLKKDGHTPVAMVRKQEQADAFAKEEIDAVLADLEDSVENFVHAINGSDAIVFTAGSGGSTGADKTLLIDLDGAVKTIEAAEQAGVKRFVMVSALGADNRETWNEAIRPYYVAKHYADRILLTSNLDFTIVRPGGLLNEAGTGKIQTGEALERGSIPREDVAKVLLGVLNAKNTYGKSFDVVSGDIEIKEEIAKI